MGGGPFGHWPAGTFNRTIERSGLLYLEPSPRRVRALVAGEVVVDTVRAALLHEHAQLPRYYLPMDDVVEGALVPSGRTERTAAAGERVYLDLDRPERRVRDAAWCHRDLPPEAPPFDGLVTFAWDALDGWLEEDEPVVGHARDPYHRVDALASSRPIRVSLEGIVLAESAQPVALFESGLPVRWYLPRADVQAELIASELETACTYKGQASYWSVRTPAGLAENVAWTYAEPLRDAQAVRDAVAFYDEHVDVDIDGVRQERPQTPWGAPRWWEAPPPDR